MEMNYSDILRVVFASFASVAVLFVLTKIMGKRQMSQLSMFDYINGITIGSIAAEMATSLQSDWIKPFTAMVVYAVISTMISMLSSRSIVLRRFFVGKSLILYYDGKLYKENFKKSKIDVNEFLVSMRNAGYFDLSELYACILEPNGIMSFLPCADEKPLTPKDMKMTMRESSYCANVIIDGKIMTQTLKNIGKDEQWLKKMLDGQNINSAEEVFLATCDMNDTFNAYKIRIGEVKEDVWI